MLRKTEYYMRDIKETTISYAGKNGSRWEKRQPRKKATPEQIECQNRINRRNRVRRLICTNFRAGDLLVTLQFGRVTRSRGVDDLVKEFAGFCRRMRRYYKQWGEAMKYIYTMEIGSCGGLHIHMLMNRIPGLDEMLGEQKGRMPGLYEMVREQWTPGPNIETIRDECEFGRVAEYLTKKPEEETDAEEYWKEMPEKDQKRLFRLGRSRNLKEPTVIVKKYSRWTLRALLDGEMPKPSKGYVVDKDSIRCGVVPWTGLSYYSYIEYRVDRHPDKMEEAMPAGLLLGDDGWEDGGSVKTPFDEDALAA